MDYLVVVRPRTVPPLDQIAGMLGAARQWYQRHESSFRAFGTFAGGGGFVVVNSDSIETVYRQIAEMPFTPFSDVHIDPFVEADRGFEIAEEVFQNMMQGMQGAPSMS